jgi:DNA primase
MKDLVYDEFIERLRAECDIVSILSDYLTLKKKGKNYWGCCPFHHEKTPSFSVTPDKGFFYCFGCQAGGNVFNFLMKIENVSFFDAVKILAQKMNVSLPKKEKTAQELERDRELFELYHVNEMARDFFYSCLTKTAYGKPAKEYLKTRGVSDEVIHGFKLGFAPPGWDKLVRAFLAREIDERLLTKAGLAISREEKRPIDRFRNRLMIPICDGRSRVVGFGGRVLDSSQPKYLNSPESMIFSKKHILFAFDSAHRSIKESGQAVVVEGYMDAITAHAYGITNVVASLGTAFSIEQAKLLLRYAQEIFFAYDSDAAGQNATSRAISILQDLGAKVKVVCIPDGKDPDEFIRKHGGDEFRLLVRQAVSHLEYQVNQAFKSVDYTTLEGKISVVAKTVPVLAQANNAVEVNEHIARIAEALTIDESAVRSEVQKFLLRHKKDKNVKVGKDISRKVAPGTAMAIEQAERYIIRLMNEDFSVIPYVQASLSTEEFQGEFRREIINLIFSEYNRGKNNISSALAVQLSESANAELSHIMLIDLESEDIVKTLDDCIRSIRLSHLKKLYETHRLKADELERMGDSRFLQELAESQRIKDEINKLHL